MSSKDVMAVPSSMDLRKRLVRALSSKGSSAREAARRFEASPSAANVDNLPLLDRFLAANETWQ